MDMRTEVRGHPTQAEKSDNSRGFIHRDQEQRQGYQTLRAVGTTCQRMVSLEDTGISCGFSVGSEVQGIDCGK